jgi:hypothetical protein
LALVLDHRLNDRRHRRLRHAANRQYNRLCASTTLDGSHLIAAPNGGSARDYLPGFAWFGAFVMGPTRERLSVCLFIGALGVNFR